MCKTQSLGPQNGNHLLTAASTPPQVSFKEIISQYRQQPQANQVVFRSVVLEQTNPGLQVAARGDIIQFYNQVFVPVMKQHLLTTLGTGVDLPLPPYTPPSHMLTQIPHTNAQVSHARQAAHPNPNASPGSHRPIAGFSPPTLCTGSTTSSLLTLTPLPSTSSTAASGSHLSSIFLHVPALQGSSTLTDLASGSRYCNGSGTTAATGPNPTCTTCEVDAPGPKGRGRGAQGGGGATVISSGADGDGSNEGMRRIPSGLATLLRALDTHSQRMRLDGVEQPLSVGNYQLIIRAGQGQDAGCSKTDGDTSSGVLATPECGPATCADAREVTVGAAEELARDTWRSTSMGQGGGEGEGVSATMRAGEEGAVCAMPSSCLSPSSVVSEPGQGCLGGGGLAIA